MHKLLIAMIREEWRLHSSYFGNFMFALFPFIQFLLALAIFALMPVISGMLPAKAINIAIMSFFLMIGLSAGAFGLLGQDILSRRLGQFGLVAQSLRLQPVSDRLIMSIFIIKDIIYYLALWIMPFILGIIATSIFRLGGMISAIALAGWCLMSFLLGLSVSFFMSIAYLRSKAAFLMAAAISLPGIALYLSKGVNGIYPAGITLCYLSLLFIASIFLLKTETKEQSRRYASAYPENALNTGRAFLIKDFTEIRRSQGGIGKIIFIYLVPFVMVYAISSIFHEIFPSANIFLMFSLLLGVLSSSVYNMLTENEVSFSRTFLPIRESDVIKSKIKAFALISLLSIPVLAYGALITDSIALLGYGLLLFFPVSLFVLSTVIMIAGLYPTIQLYNSKNFGKYIAWNVFVILALLLLPLIDAKLSASSLILMPVSYIIIRKSLIRWDKEYPLA